jgi:hypothetical protein
MVGPADDRDFLLFRSFCTQWFCVTFQICPEQGHVISLECSKSVSFADM